MILMGEMESILKTEKGKQKWRLDLSLNEFQEEMWENQISNEQCCCRE